MADHERSKWDKRYQKSNPSTEPSTFLSFAKSFLPSSGKAIDIAGGNGRNGIWLAQQGLETTVTDISSVGLQHAQELAKEKQVQLQTLCLDFDTTPFPQGPWDLILNTYFLSRPLFRVYPLHLAQGGLLLFCHPTKSNLQYHSKPSERYLLEDGELIGHFEGMDILHYSEALQDNGRYEARLIAKKS